jgi:hypothetical protein
LVRRLSTAALVGSVAALGGAGSAPADAGVRLEASAPRLVPLAAKRLAHCRRAAVLADVCPRLVPRVRAPYLSHLNTELLRASGRALAVFGLERGGEWPTRPERNRPPAMAHLIVARGHVRSLSPVWQNGVRRTRLRDGLMREPRAHLLRLGSVRWGGRKGWLELAPPYLRGGVLGNHLNFRWGPGDDERLVSLHAWEPLTESAATLRRVVESASRG